MRFDRIILSNIPWVFLPAKRSPNPAVLTKTISGGYIGFNLLTFREAIPLLKLHPAAFDSSNVLTCPPRFKNMSMLNDESVALHEAEDLAQALHVRYLQALERPADYAGPIPFQASDYHAWGTASQYQPRAFEDLLPKANFNHWVHSILLKILFPVQRDHDRAAYGVSQMIRSLCNLSVFFRLLIHLHSLGFPSHWLSQVLTTLLTDLFVTTARPLQGAPLAMSANSQ